MSQLKQELTLFDLTMIAIGATIGSGIFLTPSIIMKALPSPIWVLAVWLLGGLIALCGALTYAELGAMMPGAGGIYVYLSRSFGDLFGFLYGWIFFIVINTGSLAALGVAFATYLGYFVPLNRTGIALVAITGLFLITVINVLSVKAGAIFSDLFTVLKIIGIFGLIAIGFGWGSFGAASFSASLVGVKGSIAGAFALAMIGVQWSFGGWHHATFIAAEAKNPRRDVPRAMIIGAAVVTLIYVLANLAYMFLLSPGQIAGSNQLAADAVQSVLGPIGGSLIALVIFISTFGTSGIYSLAAPRIYYAMANDGIFFKRVAEIHPKFKTPAFSIIFQNTWAAVLILFWGTFENLISYVVFTEAIFFAIAAASIFVFRKRQPQQERSYKTLGYPFTPLLFIGFNTWLVINTLSSKPLESFAGLGFVLLGIPLYYFFKRNQKKS